MDAVTLVRGSHAKQLLTEVEGHLRRGHREEALRAITRALEIEARCERDRSNKEPK